MKNEKEQNSDWGMRIRHGSGSRGMFWRIEVSGCEKFQQVLHNSIGLDPLPLPLKNFWIRPCQVTHPCTNLFQPGLTQYLTLEAQFFPLDL